MGRNSWPVTKSNRSKSVMPKKFSPSQAPSDSEQTAPIRQQHNVTSRAARLRGSRNSSWKKAVLTSWSEISDVRAAKASSA